MAVVMEERVEKPSAQLLNVALVMQQMVQLGFLKGPTTVSGLICNESLHGGKE